MNSVCESRTRYESRMYMSHELGTGVTNLVYESRTGNMGHELGIWVTYYVYICIDSYKKVSCLVSVYMHIAQGSWVTNCVHSHKEKISDRGS